MITIKEAVHNMLDKHCDFWYTLKNSQRKIIMAFIVILSAAAITTTGNLVLLFFGKLIGIQASLLLCVVWMAITGVLISLLDVILCDRIVLKNESYKDPLTGLFNRRFVELEGRRMIKRANRRDELVCMCFIDLNKFKKINDAYSHLAGDAALVVTAQNILKLTRSDDLAGRYAGDEFIIVSIARDEKEADQMHRRIKDGLSHMPFKYGDMDGVSLSASVGNAYCSTESGDAEKIFLTLVRQADIRMLEEKNKS